MSRPLMNLGFVYLLLSGVCPSFTLAQQPSSGENSQTIENGAPAAVVTSELKRQLGSPEATMRTFRDAMRRSDRDAVGDAANCLDLSDFQSESAAAMKQTLSYKLNLILDRMIQDHTTLVYPNESSSESEFVLANGVLQQNNVNIDQDDIDDLFRIRIVQGDDSLWRFSKETVADIDGLYTRWKDRPSKQLAASQVQLQVADKMPFSLWLRELFPEALQVTHFLIPDYQWICLLVLIVLGFMADLLVRALLRRMTVAWFRFIVKSKELDQAERRVWRPVGLLVQGMVWYLGTRLIELPPMVLDALLTGLKFFAIVAGIWTAFRFVDLLASYMKRKASTTATRFDDLLVPLVAQSLKVLCIAIGVIVFAQTFDWKLTGLLGGLGIGGVALALASQDAVSNLFGSLTILADRPFEIGDWIVTEGAEGTVESVGFRSSRIRTFYNSVITLPNSRLTTTIVDNMGRRRFRRIRTMLSVEYGTTPEQIDAFCEGIRELIRRHPYTRKDYFHVYLNQFGNSSLDVLLYCFIRCPDWAIELRERHRLFLDIMRLANRLGVSFAFPTRTLHMYSETRNGSNPLSQLEDPATDGKSIAADIAGPLLAVDELPGPVQFGGPAVAS